MCCTCVTLGWLEEPFTSQVCLGLLLEAAKLPGLFYCRLLITELVQSGLVSAAGQKTHRLGFILVGWVAVVVGRMSGRKRVQCNLRQKNKTNNKKNRGFDQHNCCRIRIWICYHGNGGSLLGPWYKYRPHLILPCFIVLVAREVSASIADMLVYVCAEMWECA